MRYLLCDAINNAWPKK